MRVPLIARRSNQSILREIKPVNLKGNQPWIIIGKTEVEVEIPVLWSSDANSWLTGKVPDAAKDWEQEKRVSEDEMMAGWHHWCKSWSSSILVIWCKQLTHWKSPWCWERLKAEGEEGIRGWDGWMASPMQWTWTWGNSRRWWGTGRPGVLLFMGVTKLDMTSQLNNWLIYFFLFTFPESMTT